MIRITTKPLLRIAAALITCSLALTGCTTSSEQSTPSENATKQALDSYGIRKSHDLVLCVTNSSGGGLGYTFSSQNPLRDTSTGKPLAVASGSLPRNGTSCAMAQGIDVQLQIAGLSSSGKLSIPPLGTHATLNGVKTQSLYVNQTQYIQSDGYRIDIEAMGRLDYPALEGGRITFNATVY